MKTESCGTCKFRTGSRCNKNKEYMEDSDWCSAYKVIPTEKSQLRENCTWLIKQFDILHNILCPQESGNWQEEVEQVVKAVVKLQEERWRKVVKETLDESRPVSL